MKLMKNIVFAIYSAVAISIFFAILYFALTVLVAATIALSTSSIEFSASNIGTALLFFVISGFCIITLITMPREIKLRFAALNGNIEAEKKLQSRQRKYINSTMRINSLMLAILFSVLLLFGFIWMFAHGPEPGDILVIIFLVAMVVFSVKLAAKYWK